MNVQNVQMPKCLTVQPHCSTPPFKRDNFPVQHHKIHQNVQLNEQRKMHPLRPPEHNQQHSKRYVQSLHLLEDPEAVDMENAQGL